MEKPRTLHVDKPWGRGPIREPFGEREHSLGGCAIWGLSQEPPARRISGERSH